MATHKIILDTSKVQSLPKILTARIGEKGSCLIVAEIANNGSPYLLSDYTARFECVTTAQKVVRDAKCTISGNTVTYTLDESVTSSTGLITVAYFALLKDTTVIETTENFSITVLPNAESLGSGVPENYYSEIDELIRLLEEQKQEYATAEGKRATAESSRVEAESSRVSAESTRASKETARQSAESTRETKETARQTAEGARVVDESARVDAEAARVGAETGRMTAETSRATEEGKRVSAESARATNETAREAAVASATNAANEATTNANTATTAANSAAAKADASASASATQTAACAAATDAAMDVATTALSKRRADTLYANAIIGSAQGDMVHIEDAWEADAIGLTVPGKSVQDGTPTPDAPVPIVTVTSPVRIRTHDGIFYVKHAGGLFDWSITNADNLTWFFPDGTTSNANRPSRTMDAGTVKAVCDDWTKGSMEISDQNTNSAFVGDLSDLPPVTYYLSMDSCRNLTGNISDLPPVTYYLSMDSCRNLTGNISDLPRVTYLLSMDNCTNLTGNISDLPQVTNYLGISNCSKLTGNISDLPPVTNLLSMYNCSNLTGNISDLPPVTNYLGMYNCSNLTGNISDLPPVTNYLSMYNCSKLTGNIADLPPVTYMLNMGNCSNLTGVLNVAGTVREIYLQGTGMSASDTDQTLINLAATTTVTSGGVLQIKKNRTSASDAAFAYLSSRFAITEV